jgi:hypothetical protein
MGPGESRGLGASGGAILMAVVVAVAVLIMVDLGGNQSRPLVQHNAVAMSPAPAPAAGQSQG